MAYELRLSWHTNPPFYAIRTVFIGGGGGLQFVDGDLHRQTLDPADLPTTTSAPDVFTNANLGKGAFLSCTSNKYRNEFSRGTFSVQ